MRIGTCEACVAKDQHIAFLQTELARANERLGNMIDPMLEARTASIRLRMQQAGKPEPAQTGPRRISAAAMGNADPDRPSLADAQAAQAALDAENAETERDRIEARFAGRER